MIVRGIVTKSVTKLLTITGGWRGGEAGAAGAAGERP